MKFHQQPSPNIAQQRTPSASPPWPLSFGTLAVVSDTSVDMICPKCGDEYQAGFRHCADCDVDLVEVPSPPLDPPPLQIVTVLATGDPVRLEMAKSLLDSAGVDYWVKGEGLQDLFGGGRMGAGFNLALGPMLLQVNATDESDATAILAEVPTDVAESPDS